MKKSIKSNGNNLAKQGIKERENMSKLKNGKDIKKTAVTDFSSKNNSKTLNKEKKKSNSIKPEKITKQHTATDFHKKNIIPNKKVEYGLKHEKTEFKRNITNKHMKTIVVTNTKQVIKQQPYSKKDLSKGNKNLKVNVSNPNFSSSLPMNTCHKKKTSQELKLKNETSTKEEDEDSRLKTDFNRHSPKKTDTNHFFNIDELPSKMSSSYYIKTQELDQKLIKNTLCKEANQTLERTKNKNKTIKLIMTQSNRNKHQLTDRETQKNKRPKSEHKTTINNNLDTINTYTKNKNDNNIVKSYKTLIKRPLSGIRKSDEFSINNIVNEVSTSTEGSIFRGKIDDYIFGKEIGKGAYAIVKIVTHKILNKKFAIKIYEKFKLIDPVRKNSVKREIEILKKIDHNSIVKLHEVIDTPKQILLVTELVNGVSLLAHLKSKPNRRLDECDAKHIFRQVLEGIKYLHNKNIFHRDIKLENLIIDESNTVKIIDFGFATVSHKTKPLNFFCGTPSYMPPEIVQKKDYLGPSAEIWSCGILLYTILCGSFPFRGLNEKELFLKITKGYYFFPDHLSLQTKELIKKILIVNSSHRPTVETVLSNIWFESDNIGSSSELKQSKEIKLE